MILYKKFRLHKTAGTFFVSAHDPDSNRDTPLRTECSRIKVADITSKNMRIKLVQGKGNKDRYTLLSSFALTTFREYFRRHRPAIYLFEGKQKGKSMHCRSIEFLLIINKVSEISFFIRFKRNSLTENIYIDLVAITRGNILRRNQKAEIVWEGVFIADRVEKIQKILLYQINNFYVEVFYHP